MSQALNSLQQEAAAMLAAGKTPSQVREELQLSVSSFESWRQTAGFTAEVDRLKAESTTQQQQAANSSSEKALDDELDRMSS